MDSLDDAEGSSIIWRGEGDNPYLDGPGSEYMKPCPACEGNAELRMMMLILKDGVIEVDGKRKRMEISQMKYIELSIGISKENVFNRL